MGAGSLKSGKRLPIVGLILLCSACKPSSFYFKELEIDRMRHLIPHKFVSVTEPALESYYFIMHTGTGFDVVTHVRTLPLQHGHEILLFLETDKSGVLDQTLKREQILHGSFGTIYADKTCWYSRPIENGTNSVSVHYNQNGGGEAPVQLSGAPSTLPPLTSVSLVRVFRADAEDVIASANYEANGQLGSLDIGRGENGNWKSGGVSVQSGSPGKFLMQYGIPPHIDLVQYAETQRMTLPPVDMPQEVAVFNQHYGHNKVIRQDTLVNGSAVSTRFLQPSVTEEERLLESTCESRFQTQISRGISTVW